MAFVFVFVPLVIVCANQMKRGMVAGWWDYHGSRPRAAAFVGGSAFGGSDRGRCNGEAEGTRSLLHLFAFPKYDPQSWHRNFGYSRLVSLVNFPPLASACSCGGALPPLREAKVAGGS